MFPPLAIGGVISQNGGTVQRCGQSERRDSTAVWPVRTEGQYSGVVSQNGGTVQRCGQSERRDSTAVWCSVEGLCLGLSSYFISNNVVYFAGCMGTGLEFAFSLRQVWECQTR